MRYEELIEELHQVASQLGVTVRYEKGDFDGGYCIMKDQKLLLVNKRLTANKRASVLALGMHEIGLDHVYLKPALRAYVEDETARALRAAKEQ